MNQIKSTYGDAEDWYNTTCLHGCVCLRIPEQEDIFKWQPQPPEILFGKMNAFIFFIHFTKERKKKEWKEKSFN